MKALREQVTTYPPTQPTGGRVLSIQSHTVHGYVGNKSAVFPLQLLGFDVDPINSVQFSNHTGYPSFKGQVLGGNELKDLIDGLNNNSLLTQHTHMLTGYIGSESFLEAVLYALQCLRKENPNLVYVCDPVLGDNGKLYVPESLVEVYKEKVIHQATLLTPNQYECELLTGIKIKTKDDAIKACKLLHGKGIEVVLLTSLEYGANEIKSRNDNGKMLTLLVSKMKNARNNSKSNENHNNNDNNNNMEVYELTIPKLDGYFTGTGDLIASNFLAWYYRYPNDLPLSMEKAVATVQGVIETTLRTVRKLPEKGEAPPELKLIQSKTLIENPVIKFRCKPAYELPVIKGVIFDLDGTLTLPHLIDFKEMRNKLGMTELDKDIITFCRDENKHTKEERERLMNIVETMEKNACGDNTSLQPGVVQMLKALKTNGFQIGICTRNCYAAVESFLSNTGIPTEFFDLILTRDAPFVKPNGNIIRHFSDAWGDRLIAPSELIIIGDSADDALTGKWGGSYVGIVTNDTNSEAQKYADVLFHTMGDIVNFLSCHDEVKQADSGDDMLLLGKNNNNQPEEGTNILVR
jgi:pyridoxine kinase